MLSRYLVPTTLVSTHSPSPSTLWPSHGLSTAGMSLPRGPFPGWEPGWVAVHGPGSPHSLFSPLLQKWVVFALSTSSSLGCLSCLLGMAVSIGLTLGSQGQTLLAPCTITHVSRECPFDPTRVYVSPSGMWAGDG